MNRFLGDWPARSDGNSTPQTDRLKHLTPYFAIAAIILFCLAIVAATQQTSINQFLTESTNLLHRRFTITRNPIDGLDYVRIPAGSFMMGCSPDDDQCDPNELPAHQARIPHDFVIGTTEVTNAAFHRFRLATFPFDKRYRRNPDLPAVSVTWFEARRYCEWAGMHMPSEAQWEYAARAGTSGSGYGFLTDIAQRQGNPSPLYWDPFAVARKQPNGWGLQDVLGNVREWVDDRYSADYRPGAATSEDRVVRGGGHRVSERISPNPSTQDHVVGFRCAGELR